MRNHAEPRIARWESEFFAALILAGVVSLAAKSFLG